MPGLILQAREDSIALVTLHNPDKLNAVDAHMWRELARVMGALSGDESLRCVILRGSGGHFAAGGDIHEFATVRDTFERAWVYHERWVAGALGAIAQCRHPTLAMIAGNCIGGGLEIACACDLRIAAAGARFGIPIKRLGFAIAHGELRALLGLVSPAVALELLLEGRILGAAEAAAKGLLTRVVPDAALEEETRAAAQRIAAGAPLVARMHKKLVRRLTSDPAPLSADEIRENFAYLDSEDYRIGYAAFLARSDPDFVGR
jgi:enoyl-CoA hydratase/carnithine racemase